MNYDRKSQSSTENGQATESGVVVPPGRTTTASARSGGQGGGPSIDPRPPVDAAGQQKTSHASPTVQDAVNAPAHPPAAALDGRAANVKVISGQASPLVTGGTMCPNPELVYVESPAQTSPAPEGFTQVTLDVVFAPGVYGVASIGPIRLDLGGNPAPAAPRIDVVLRGDPAGPPVVFRDMGIVVQARRLRLAHLILTGRRQEVLDARIACELVIDRCVVAGNDWAGPWSGALLRITGLASQPAYAVEIIDSWFVHNGAHSDAALILVNPATGSSVERVALQRVTFVDNQLAAELAVREARTIHAEDILTVKRGATGAWLDYARSARVTVAGSTFIVDDPAAIAREDTRTWCSGMVLSRSQIYVTGASRTLPAGMRGDAELLDDAVRQRSHASGDALDAASAAITASVPDPAAGRARLREALGL